jgi:anti-sigma regulatory factor (Ser/Thr protein kinase)
MDDDCQEGSMDQQAAGVPQQDATPHRAADLDVTVTAVPQYLPLLRETARCFAVRCGLDRPDDVRLAVAEACLNAVRYAYPDGPAGPVRVHGTTDGRVVRLTVEDRGGGLRPRPNGGGLGLGLPIIARVCDHWSLADADCGGTRVCMEFRLGRGRPW